MRLPSHALNTRQASPVASCVCASLCVKKQKCDAYPSPALLSQGPCVFLCVCLCVRVCVCVCVLCVCVGAILCYLSLTCNAVRAAVSAGRWTFLSEPQLVRSSSCRPVQPSSCVRTHTHTHTHTRTSGTQTVSRVRANSEYCSCLPTQAQSTSNAQSAVQTACKTAVCAQYGPRLQQSNANICTLHGKTVSQHTLSVTSLRCVCVCVCVCHNTPQV